MADETDFIDLYGKLRLAPGCSLEEFKRAYRRNVAMWHPDRRQGSRADMIAAARLQRLTVQYNAAMDFHRRHGRLPGAPLAPRVADAPPAQAELTEGEPLSSFVEPTAESTTAGSVPPNRDLRGWWFVGLVSAVVAIVWATWPSSPAVPEAEAAQEASVPVESAKDEASMLSLGMTPEEVVAVEGEPLRKADDRWEYGPSWVRFENGSLVDWYSSPLRALRVGSTRPQP